MSVSELTQIISPAFTEETIFKIVTTKRNLTEIKILNLTINNDQSKKGDSYLSTICRFNVIASGKNSNGDIEEVAVPVIVKYFPKNVPRQQTFRSADFFKTEIYFYEKVWPEMKKFKLSKLPNEPDEIPLMLAAYCDGKNDFLALEDISYQGFTPSSRDDVITKEKLLVFLQVLAHFHAIGIVLKHENPDFVKIAANLPESYFADNLRAWYENFMYKSMGVQYREAVKELLPVEYYEKVTKLYSGDFYGKIIKSCTVNDKFSSVTEGDAWVPNFLGKSDSSGDNRAAKLIDFQLARYAPITNDLFHFLLSSVPNDMTDEWDNLIMEYHKYLSKRIEELGGDKDLITLKEIHDEFKQHPFCGLLMGMESFIMSQLTENEVADLDELQGEAAYPLENIWVLPVFDKYRKEKLAMFIKRCVDKGYIS